MEFDQDFDDVRYFHSFFGIFDKQEDALTKANVKGGVLPIFAQDHVFEHKGERNVTGTKKYITASYSQFWLYYSSLPTSEKCIYEILDPRIRSHLHVDAEFETEYNKDISYEKMDEELRGELMLYLKEMKYIESESECEVIILESSSKKKFSMHYIIKIKGKVFKNNFHCGAFMRNFSIYIESKYGNPEENKFYVRTIKSDSQKRKRDIIQFVADLKIYTTYRVFRILGSSKAADPSRVLYMKGEPPFENEGQKEIDINMNKLVNSFIQYSKHTDITIECKELDGTEPLTGYSNKRAKIGPIKTTLQIKPMVKEETYSSSIPDYLKPLNKMIQAFLKEKFKKDVDFHCKVFTYFKEKGKCMITTRCSYCLLKLSSEPETGGLHGSTSATKNHVYYIIDLVNNIFYQKCHSENWYCVGKNSDHFPIPEEYRDITKKYSEENQMNYQSDHVIDSFLEIFSAYVKI